MKLLEYRSFMMRFRYAENSDNRGLLFEAFSMPPKGKFFWHDWRENHSRKENYFLCLILTIITTYCVKKIQKSTKGKLHKFISSEKRIELCSAWDQVWCSDNRGSDNRGTDNRGCTVPKVEERQRTFILDTAQDLGNNLFLVRATSPLVLYMYKFCFKSFF